jgi:hypothetical protein
MIWHTVWWTQDDQFRHWTNCHVFPTRGRYTAGDPAVIAAHYAQFRELGIDFLIMDDTNGVDNDGGRIKENIGAWFDFMDAKVCLFDGSRLDYQGALPRRAAVIVAPDAVFERLGRQYLSR